MAISDLNHLWEGGHSRNTQVGGDQLTETYYVNWDLATETVNALIGSEHSDISWLICTSVSTSPFGDVSDAGSGYLNAKLSVNWETRKPNRQEVNSDWSTWQESWQATGEAFTIGEGFKWVSDDKAVTGEDASGVKIFPAAGFTLTGTVDNFNENAKTKVMTVQGLVNSDTVIIKGFAYSDAQLLFEGLDADEGTDGQGNTVHRVTYKFAYKHLNSWNEFWRKDKTGGPGFEEMSDAGGGKPYSAGNFTNNLDPSNW